MDMKYIVIFVTFGVMVHSSKILHIMPFSSKSHYIAQKDLPLELARRGHEVYVITPFNEKEHPPTYHQIFVEPTPIWNQLFDVPPNIFNMMDLSFGQFQTLLYTSGFLLNYLVFNSTDVQNFLKEDHEFDLVINEVFFQESLYMFAHKYQAPQVLLTTFGNSFKVNYFSGNPLQLSTLYHEYGSSLDPLSFIGRLRNFYFTTYDLFWIKWWYLPRQEEYARKYFKNLPTPIPSLEEIAANVSLVLMNSHFSVDTPAAYLPNFIEVAGLNLKASNKPLPQDLQKILDDAKEGVIYMSFGSNVRIIEMENSKLEAFLKVFEKLKKYKILLKWEDLSKKPKYLPNNIILREWFPQKDVLAHSNVKLFIGHGGLLGLHESISSGIPILGVPVFGDQFGNLVQAKQNGHGEIIEYKNINEENVKYLINKMLNDNTYKKRAEELAIRFNDRPMNGLETAIWWIEYVIRHKGAHFIKSPVQKMSFFSSTMLDIYLFITIIPLIFVYLLIRIIKHLFKNLNTVKNKKQKKI